MSLLDKITLTAGILSAINLLTIKSWGDSNKYPLRNAILTLETLLCLGTFLVGIFVAIWSSP